MSVLNIESDARRAFDVLKKGGIAIIPMDVGYTIVGGSAESLKLIFATKRRAPEKLNAMIGDMTHHREVHQLDTRGYEMVSAIVDDYDLPLGCIAPYRTDHPIMKALDPSALVGSTLDGTLAMLLNAGPFHREICKLSRNENFPIFGSSCNFTNTGTKFKTQDIPDELLNLADVVIDYGLRKYNTYDRSSTLINFETMKVVRQGTCYELIEDVLQRHFNYQLVAPKA